MTGLLRRYMNMLLHRGLIVQAEIFHLAGLDLQAADGIETGADRSGDQRRAVVRVKALIVTDIIVHHVVLIRNARHISGRRDYGFFN